MSQADSLGDRMKEYESTTKSFLLRRTPVIIRIDGRAFHTFTKRIVPSMTVEDVMHTTKVRDESLIETPYSVKLHNVMSATTSLLFHQMQNAVFAYTQSDEISILLRDWDRHETQQWFGGNIQKIVSISASIATGAFNQAYQTEFSYTPTWGGDFATFDSRVYNIPKEEVTNYFIWRQQDASRNSVQMYGRHFFSQKEMAGKNNSEVQDMLMLQKGKNWNDLPTWMKRGTCVSRPEGWSTVSSAPGAKVNDEPPIFTQDRQFVEQWLAPPAQEV